MENELFICDCSSNEHQLIFSYDEDYKCVYVSIHLNPQYRWYRRLWYAIKYLFGYKCKYGNFEEFIFNPEDYPKLEKIATLLKNRHE